MTGKRRSSTSARSVDVDDLLLTGHRNLTVLDISQVAIDVAKNRLVHAANSIHWLREDVTKEHFQPRSYEVWHDRAVFHFLTKPGERLAYIRNVAWAVKPGGHVIVSTAGPEGPEKCSGLDVTRYDAESLHNEFGTRFLLVESSKEIAPDTVWNPAVSLLPLHLGAVKRLLPFFSGKN